MSRYYYGRIRCSLETFEKIRRKYDTISYSYNFRVYKKYDNYGDISFDVKNGLREEEDIIPMITQFHDADLVYWDEEFIEEVHYYWDGNEVKYESREITGDIDDCLVYYEYSDCEKAEYLQFHLDRQGKIVIEDFENNKCLNYNVTKDSIERIKTDLNEVKDYINYYGEPLIVDDKWDNIELSIGGYNEHHFFTTDKEYFYTYLKKEFKPNEKAELYNEIVDYLNNEMGINNIDFRFKRFLELKNNHVVEDMDEEQN